MFCSFCGKELNEGQSFCPYCGGKKEDYEKKVKLQQSAEQEATVKTKKSKLPVIVISVILIAAIAVGAVFIPGLLKKDEVQTGKETVWVISSVKTYYPSGDIMQDYTYSYNESGDIDAVTGIINWEGTRTEKERNEYNEKGLLVKTIRSTDNVDESYDVLEYDSDDRLISKVFYRINGEAFFRQTYEYDDRGNCISEKSNVNGTHITYEYNDKDQCIKENHGSVVYTHEYDSDGNRVKTYYNGNINYEYKYDVNGNITEFIQYGDGEVIIHEEYTYDSNGDCVKIAVCAFGDESVISESEYDDNRNCIRKTVEIDKAGLNFGGAVTVELTYTAIEVLPERAEQIRTQTEEIVNQFNFTEILF